jgi:hypothetical protein
MIEIKWALNNNNNNNWNNWPRVQNKIKLFTLS